MKLNRGKRAASIAIIVAMSVLGLIFIMPYVWMILSSFKDKVEIIKSKAFFPSKWIWDNYITVFTKAPIVSWFFNSVFVTVIGTVAMLFTSSIAGFVFAKYEFKFKNALFLFVLATMMVPAQVTMIPSFLIIDRLGMYDSLSALIIPGLVGGFGIFLCRQFIEDIPDSLCEAACIDGANDFYIYVRIIVPLIKAAIGALTIFTFLAKWNDYLGPLLFLSNPKNMTMPLALNFFSGQHNSDNGAIMAAAAIVTLPVTIVFLCLQKQFIKGIAIAGMK